MTRLTPWSVTERRGFEGVISVRSQDKFGQEAVDTLIKESSRGFSHGVEMVKASRATNEHVMSSTGALQHARRWKTSERM